MQKRINLSNAEEVAKHHEQEELIKRGKETQASMEVLDKAIARGDLALVRATIEAEEERLLPHLHISRAKLWQPIHVAVEFGHLAIVKMLIEEFDVKIDCRCQASGYTPLMYACQFENQEIIEYLIKQGAAIDCESVCGRTALHILRDSGSGTTIEWLKS